MSGQIVTAILLLGGSGSRFKESLPKQFLDLSGKKLFLYALETFLKSPLIHQVVIVYNENFLDLVTQTIYSDCKTDKSVVLVPGGASRQESAYAGLKACPQTDIVLIHDAARPFVTQEMIQKSIAAMSEYDAACVAIPCTDTLFQLDSTGNVTDILDRTQFHRAQTPQTFRYPVIMKAHNTALQNGVTSASDDCSLVVSLKKTIHLVPGREENIKVTQPTDLLMAEHIIARDL